MTKNVGLLQRTYRSRFSKELTILLSTILAVSAVHATLQSAELEAGFGVVDITPDLDSDRPVWLAGYGQNRRATRVHDPIFARAVVFSDGEKKIALVVADVVGLFYPTVQNIRQRLEDFDYVMVAATHSHEGPDTMGLWGPSPLKSGVDPQYMQWLEERCAQAVRVAESQLAPASAVYGTAKDDRLLRDTRLPVVFDGVLRAVRLVSNDGQSAGLIVQWNCHPEAMGPKNTEITADFLYATIAKLEMEYQCPVVAVSGALGGLMAPPKRVIQDEQGRFLSEGDFVYSRLYGEAVAKLAMDAVESSEPISMTPFSFAAHRIAVPMANPVYQLGAMLGLIQREAYSWSGNHRELGESIEIQRARGNAAIATEVSYLRLGQLHIAGIPGELYPELVYGEFQDPVEPNVDFPDAPTEKPVVEILPGERFLLVGLANDELGYIIPKRQWDDQAPFAYGRTTKQYGEINSIGPETAPILMQALEECVQAAESSTVKD